ncbi:MAG TPA: holo-ACP synthase [Candidatus Goldiibacteriota bacterium]|nr:holo-ACP synthase [Candidatus Goldiibacteriota bacterium]
MIKGLGIDICDVKKLARAMKKNKKFSKRVYSAAELKYCSSKRNSLLSLAGRFAAKEAFIKAVGDDKSIRLSEIEIVNDRHGKPAIRLGPKIKAVLKRKKAKSLSLSITHTDSAAAAVCLLC